MLPIRSALERTLVAYLKQVAAQYAQCAALAQSVSWGTEPTETTPGTAEAIPRPIVAGHTAGDLPKPTHLVVAAAEVEVKDSSAGLFCVKVRLKMMDAGNEEGLAAQEKTTLAIMACLPLLTFGGAEMAQAVAMVNAVPGAEVIVIAYSPSEPFDREGISPDGRHFGS